MFKYFPLYLLLMSSTYADMASDALESAKTALYIQSGLQTTTQQFTRYCEHRAKIYGDKMGVSKYAVSSLYFYKIYREKSFSIPYKNQKFSLGIGSFEAPMPFIQWQINY